MFFRQYDLACLSLFSYLIGDITTGQAVVVDPQRDISGYLADAAEHGLTITRVIETHVHADFLSGHRELAAATGALISYGSRAKLGFDFDPLADGHVLSLGEVTLEIRHTPGHTPEGISIIVRATANAAPTAVLTGDTLFIGDVGRPDLLASAGMSAGDMAHDLYRSLHDKLLTLPDETAVYPAHGAGSACGKHMSSATSSTIGEQRVSNYALQPMSIDNFTAVVTAGQSATPPYFAHAVHANRSGDQALLDERDVAPSIGIDAALDAVAAGAVLLDVRTPETFASGHLRGSINVGLAGRFAEYAGDIITHGQPIVLVADEHDAQEARIRLARIGFDNVIGTVVDIEQVLVARPDQAAAARRLSAVEVASWASVGEGPTNVQIVDVRNPSETEAGVITGAINIPVAQFVARLGELDPRRPTVVYCAGGYRSSIAASTLRGHGFELVADIIGGYSAWHSLKRPG
jgi:hydroxyacylglutathione hydrolase